MTITPVFTINSILLAIATLLSAYLFACKTDIRKLFNAGIERLNNEYGEKQVEKELIKYGRPVYFKMTLAEKTELHFIEKSNVRHYIPFINFYTLMFISALIFVIMYRPMYGILMFFPSTVTVCAIFSMIPIYILDLMGRYNSEKIRRKLAGFISILNRWRAVKEDIFYAFEKSMDSGLGEPLKTFVRDMVIQVNRGIEPLEALDMLQMKVDNPQFRDFIINIKQNIKHRGDMGKLLTNLENQFYKIEEEYNRRRISTYKDRLIIYCVMFGVLFFGYYFLKLNPQVEDFYLGTLQGKLLMTVFCLLYTSGFYMSFKIVKFKH